MKRPSRIPNRFLRRFIEDEQYLQNPPLETKRFIALCEKRGLRISEKYLECLEKERLFPPFFRIALPKLIRKNGRQAWRAPNYKLRSGEKFIRYSAYSFPEHQVFLEWLNKGYVFEPSQKAFGELGNFKTGESGQFGQKILSFYSAFQTYWLEQITKWCPPKFSTSQQDMKAVDVALCEREGEVYLNASLEIKLSDKPEYQLTKDRVIKYLDLKDVIEKGFKEQFTWQVTREKLLKRKNDFDKTIRFLLSIQHIYYPHARSGGQKITVTGELKEWHKKRYKYNPRKELKVLQLTVDDVVKWYKDLSDKAHFHLGVARDDWIQLWKNINWDEKDKLEGSVRLGIDYLQWSVMLKRFIEDCEKREILDIDEITNISAESILSSNLKAMNRGPTLRPIRNMRYYDPKDRKSHYHNTRRRLFYLANDFGIDYQPRVMAFVEGKTEEVVLEKALKDWYGLSPEDLGIEFVNLRGITKILSTAKTAEELRKLLTELDRELKRPHLSKGKKTKLNDLIRALGKTSIIISNLQSFISYNLEKWQIIPFFIADDEGNIKKILDSEKIIKFHDNIYDVPSRWKFIWGTSHCNRPFNGKDFEFANFSDQEIARVLKQVLRKTICVKQIRDTRQIGCGISKITPEVTCNKVKIAEQLFTNLFKEYKEGKDTNILERPIFKLLHRITDLATFNHLPVDRNFELKNKEIIREQLDPNYKKQESSERSSD